MTRFSFRLTFICLALGSILFVQSCSIVYYSKVAQGHLSLMTQREDIGQLLDACSQAQACDLSDTEIEKLQLTQSIRTMASETMALPVEDAYSSYVDTGRRYVVWNVFAAEEFSVKPKAWCYPIIGCASYRGYYEQIDAEEYAKGMEEQGFETHVGGVRAYSSLGWFADPVLNTMINQQDVYLVSLLIHEIAHRVAYAKDDTAFNESYATAMEQFGVEIWLARRTKQNTPQSIAVYHKREDLHQAFIAQVIATRSALDEVYRSDISDEDKRAAKAERFQDLEASLAKLDERYGLNTRYANWAKNINNAKIAPVNTYNQWVKAIRNRLDEYLAEKSCDVSALGQKPCRTQLIHFYEEIRDLAELHYDERQLILERWNQTNSSSPVNETLNRSS